VKVRRTTTYAVVCILCVCVCVCVYTCI
jgi:hypothetical protein